MKFRQQIGKNLAIYLGSAWVIMEASNFFIERYGLDPMLLDVLIILLVFGIFISLVFNFFKGRWNKKAIAFQTAIIILSVISVQYFLTHPLNLNPRALRIIKLGEKRDPFSHLSSIAVLPFSNYMGDESQEYLLAGMHDGLITEMGKLGQIRTISRTSSLAYKNTDKPLKKIASELEVEAIVETSLTKVDSMIELRVKLINVYPQESILWDHSFSVYKNELPNLYHQVTREVAKKVGDVLVPKNAHQLLPKRVPVPGAYEAYLKGTYYTGFLTKEGFELAQQHFKRSISIDSLFAPAYQGLAALYASQVQMGFVSNPENYPIRDSLLTKAYQLDSTNAEILLGMAAHNTWGNFNWEDAEKYYLESIEYNPNITMTRAAYAHFLMIQNRWEEAWKQMNYAIELDPLNPWTLAFSAAMYGVEGKVLSAAKTAEKLIQIAPNHPMAQGMLLNKYMALNQEEKAVKQLIKLVKIYDVPKAEEISMKGFAEGGFQAALQSLLPYLEAFSKDHFIRPWLMFELYGYANNKKKQEEWIVKMYELKDGNLPYLGIKKIALDSEVRTLIMKEIGLW